MTSSSLTGAPAGLQLSAHADAGARLDRAAHSTALDGSAPEWVHLLPAGVFSGVDGRGPYQVPDPEAVIRITRERSRGNDLPIDYGHALERPGPDGDAAPAAGWISELEAREDGIWGRVAWTASGEAKIRGREFRFLSPVFYHTPDGHVVWILRAGLTNRPNLQLVSINSSQGGDDADQEEAVALPKAIATALGLAETAAETEIVARCSSAVQAEAGLGRVAAHMQLPATASADDVIRAVSAATTPDPAKYVPREQYDQLSVSLQAAQKKDGERVVDQLIADGKLAPAQKEWAVSYHSRDAAGFQQFASGLPVIIQPGAHAQGEGRAGGSTRELTAEEKAVCSNLGITPEEFIKNHDREG